METETTISKAIHISDDKAKYDAACKQLLSEKIILAWIVKGCVEEFRDIDVSEIADRYIEGTPQISEVPVAPDEASPSLIMGTATEDKKIREGTITYDIRFHAVVPKSGEMIRLILNVEAQNDFYPGYPLTKRGVYYCSRMISSQYGSVFAESHYEKIRKVISIWICAYPPDKRQNTITRYYIKEDNFIGNVREKRENYDLMTLIMICLGEQVEDNNDTLRLLGTLLSSEITSDEKCQILQEDFDIPMSQPLERKVGLMCNLSEGVFAKGIKQGMKLQEAETTKIKEELQTERKERQTERNEWQNERKEWQKELQTERNEWQTERSTYTAEIKRLQEQIARLSAE